MEVAGAKLAAPIGPLPAQAKGTQQSGHEEVGGGVVTHLGVGMILEVAQGAQRLGR